MGLGMSPLFGGSGAPDSGSRSASAGTLKAANNTAAVASQMRMRA
jgi:hypothetical protein